MKLPKAIKWISDNPFKCRVVPLNGEQLVDKSFEMFTHWYSRPQTSLPQGTDEVVRWIKTLRPDLISVITELNEAMVETVTMPADDYDNCMNLYNRAYNQIVEGDTTAMLWIVKNRSIFTE